MRSSTVPSVCRLGWRTTNVDTLLGPENDANNLPMDLQQLIFKQLAIDTKFVRVELELNHGVRVDELCKQRGGWDMDHHPFVYTFKYRVWSNGQVGDWVGPIEPKDTFLDTDSQEDYHEAVLGTSLYEYEQSLPSYNCNESVRNGDSDEFGLTLDKSTPNARLKYSVIETFGHLAYRSLTYYNRLFSTPMQEFVDKIRPRKEANKSSYRVFDVAVTPPSPEETSLPPYVTRVETKPSPAPQSMDSESQDSQENSFVQTIRVVSRFSFSIEFGTPDQMSLTQCYRTTHSDGPRPLTSFRSPFT